MKKYIALFLLLPVILLVFTGCGTPGEEPNKTPETPTGGSTADGGGTGEVTPPPAQGGDGDDITEGAEPPDLSEAPTPVMPTLPQGTVNAVTDWGFSSEPGKGIENGLLLYRKMSALADGATVFFPEGTYELDLPMLLTGKKNIRVVGYRAVFLNTRAVNTAERQSASDHSAIPADMRDATATSGMVWIEGSENITVEGITFRYAAATGISGKVTARTSAYIDIEVTDGSVLSGNEYVMAINTFTKEGAPDRTLEQYAATHFPVERLSETKLRVSGVNATMPLGTRVYLRTSLASNYIFTIFNSRDLTFRDITMNNSFNGGFLIEHRTVNATFERVRVESHNAQALMSLNADALHLTGLGGKLVIRDCYFSRGGDDFLNVSGAAGKITALSSNRVTVALSWGADGRWAAVGDTIEFYDPTTLALLGSAEITAASGTNYTFDQLPAGVTKETILSNKSLHPEVLIENSHFAYNRARALLLQTDDITIRNCRFYGTALSAVLIAPDLTAWYEVSPARRVNISGCHFDTCGTYAGGVIRLATNHDALAAPAASYVHADISVTGCTFRAVVPAMVAVSTQEITFTRNDVTSVTGEVLHFISCKGVTYDAELSPRVTLHQTTEVTEN